MITQKFLYSLFAFLVVLSTGKLAWACVVCFGDPNSLQSRSVFYAILLLMGVVGFVLSGIAITGLVWMRRAQELQNTRQDQ
jgi:hypothetical protein